MNRFDEHHVKKTIKFQWVCVKEFLFCLCKRRWTDGRCESTLLLSCPWCLYLISTMNWSVCYISLIKYMLQITLCLPTVDLLMTFCFRNTLLHWFTDRQTERHIDRHQHTQVPYNFTRINAIYKIEHLLYGCRQFLRF